MSRQRRLCAALVVAVLSVAMGGCGAAPVQARWFGPTRASAAPGAPPDDIDNTARRHHFAPAISGTDLAQIPTFPPAPAAVPVVLPDGPSAPHLGRVGTNQPVAFLTIDDGWVKRPEAIGLLRAAHIPVTLFLTINAIRDDPDYFRQLQSAGAVIEAHTITHANLRGRSYDFQKHEACASADQLGAMFGRRPVLFRAPFGNEDATTLRAAHDCSLHAVLFWTETVNAGIVRFQTVQKVQSGDIILMHFRPTFVVDFLAALHAIHDAGLTPALLEDYVR